MGKVLKDRDMERLVDYLSGLTQANFYGKLVVSLEKGKVVNIKREENIKLVEL